MRVHRPKKRRSARAGVLLLGLALANEHAIRPQKSGVSGDSCVELMTEGIRLADEIVLAAGRCFDNLDRRAGHRAVGAVRGIRDRLPALRRRQRTVVVASECASKNDSPVTAIAEASWETSSPSIDSRASSTIDSSVVRLRTESWRTSSDMYSACETSEAFTDAPLSSCRESSSGVRLYRMWEEMNAALWLEDG